LLLLQLLKGVSAKHVDSHMFQVPELLTLQAIRLDVAKPDIDPQLGSS